MPADLLLAIETSNPSAVAADGAGGEGPGVALARLSGAGEQASGLRRHHTLEMLGVEMLRTATGSRGGHDDDLMPAIARLFARVGAAPRDVARVAVSVGPGGYTGLRVACAAGKMIAEAAGASCVAVPTALVLLESERDKAGVAIALASKGETVWARVAGDGPPPDSGGLVSAADIAGLASRGVRRLVADQFLPASIAAACGAAGISISPPHFSAAACARASLALPMIDPVELVPLYPREPDAVTLWRGRSKQKAEDSKQ